MSIFRRNKEKNDSNQDMSKVEMPGHIVELDAKDFEDFIKKYPLSLIDFWAPWCGPCKAMGPRLRRLSTIYKQKLAFGKLNTQENQDIAKKYKIFGIPQLIFFRNGKKIFSMTGLRSVGDIKEEIDKIIKKYN